MVRIRGDVPTPDTLAILVMKPAHQDDAYWPATPSP
jgi:hypothetical protein